MKFYFKITNNEIDSSYAYNENEVKQIIDFDPNVGPPLGYIEYISSKFGRNLGPYEKIEFLGYEYVTDTLITDKLQIVSMTEEEKKQKQEQTKSDFYNKVKYYSWTLNEQYCFMVPPTMPPQDEWAYGWDEQTKSHVNSGILKKDTFKMMMTKQE
jgi:hypothetical protein